MYRLTKEEQETVIRFDETNAPAVVYTNNLALKKKLAKLAARHTKLAQFDSSDSFGGVTYLVPKSWVKLVPPLVRSDAQKAVTAVLTETRQMKKATA
jgi:hypothetical protein